MQDWQDDSGVLAALRSTMNHIAGLAIEFECFVLSVHGGDG